MFEDRAFVAENRAQRERLRLLIERLSDEQLASPLYEDWTIAGILGHLAFWDGRALFLTAKLERGEPFNASETEPEDVDWINDATRPLVQAIPARTLANLALEIATETDRRLELLSEDRLAAIGQDSPLNPVRAEHRAEHLDEIEAGLRLAPKVSARP